jgi:hypothetical protein
MGWERRNSTSHLYYYRGRRINGRVVKEYFGNGFAAHQAAREDAERRADRDAERKAIIAEKIQMQPIHEMATDLDDATAILVEASMLAGGYHRINYGAWKRRRDS